MWTCSRCGESTDDAQETCTKCGANSPRKELHPERGQSNGDLLCVARYQRLILRAVLANLVLSVLLVWLTAGEGQPAFAVPFIIVALGIVATTIILAIRLLRALGHGGVVQALVALLMFVPYVSLATLLIVNTGATRTLRARGLRVGLMGVAQEQLDALAAGSVDERT